MRELTVYLLGLDLQTRTALVGHVVVSSLVGMLLRIGALALFLLAMVGLAWLSH
jgi:hypothetical protein